MKITFDNEKERECLEHILLDWIACCVEDPLGCEPVCRDESSSGCADCIHKCIKHQLNSNKLYFSAFGGEEYLENTSISDKFISKSNSF